MACSRQHLRRSNALRVRSDNLELLPCALRESLLALKQSRLGPAGGRPDETETSLLDQIKRGVRLKPVGEKRKRRRWRRDATSGGERSASSCSSSDDDNDEDKSTLSTILFQVLRRRYLAVQQTDDDTSDFSSIESGCNSGRPDDDLLLLGYKCRRVRYCVLYGPGDSQTCGLLERFAKLDMAGDIETGIELINDLTVRL